MWRVYAALVGFRAARGGGYVATSLLSRMRSAAFLVLIASPKSLEWGVASMSPGWVGGESKSPSTEDQPKRLPLVSKMYEHCSRGTEDCLAPGYAGELFDRSPPKSGGHFATTLPLSVDDSQAV